MRIFVIKFEDWNVLFYKLDWVLVIAFLLIVLATLWIYNYINKYVYRKSIVINEINLGIGNNSVKLTYNTKDKEIAYKLWVELSTRKIGLMFDEKHDVIVEVYDSWYEFFKIARELLKDIPASKLSCSNDLIELTENVLNKGLRPHLTIWQAKYRKWYTNELKINIEDSPQEIQRKYPYYDELVNDLINTNSRLIEYKNLMKRIAFRQK